MNAPFRLPAHAYSVTLSRQVVSGSHRPDITRPARFLRVHEVSQSSVGARFRRLAEIWLAAVLNISSVEDMILHPAYQEIIGMGPAVLPLLLEELEREPNHWFAALVAVSGGANPVAAEDQGDLDRMTDAWLQWAEAHGYR